MNPLYLDVFTILFGFFFAIKYATYDDFTGQISLKHKHGK